MCVSTMKAAVTALLHLLCGLAVLADHNEVAALKSPIDTNQADIHAVLREMSGLLAETRAELRYAKYKLEELRRAQVAGRVSFSASLQVSGHGPQIGPLNPPPILAYKHVFTNIGNHYNPHSGIFTAPVRGVYYFTAFVYGGGGRHATGVFLHKNGNPIVIAYGHQPAGVVNSSNGASLLLEVGDVVYVKLVSGTWAYDSLNHHTTFSGHLLFPM